MAAADQQNEQNRSQSRDQNEGVQAARRAAGAWLRAKREAAGLSQRQLAQAVGFEYYTFISQIESGRGRVPQDRYMAYAAALGVPARELALVMLRHYDPITHELLFGEGEAVAEAPAAAEPEIDLKALNSRLSRIEQLMQRLGK